MDISTLLTSRVIAAVGIACLVLSALAALWALVKLSYQRALGRPMPRNALTGTLDVMAELAVNVVGAVSRALRLGGGQGLFMPTVTPPPPPAAPRPPTPPPIPPATLGVLLALAVGCSAARSRLVDVDPTTPTRSACTRGAWRCNAAVPEHCDTDERDSTVTRWWPSVPLGDGNRPAPCARCVVDGDGGVAHCAAAESDGGAL